MSHNIATAARLGRALRMVARSARGGAAGASRGAWVAEARALGATATQLATAAR